MYLIPQQEWISWRDAIWSIVGYEPRIGEQQGFHNAEQPNKIIIAGNQFGKSYALAKEALPLLLLPNRHIGILGATSELASEEYNYIEVDLYKLVEAGFLSEKDFQYNVKNHTLTFKHGRSRTNWSWLKVGSSRNSAVYEGKQLDLLIISEASNEGMNVDWIIHKMPSRLMTRQGCYLIATTPLEAGKLYFWTKKQKTRKDCYYRDKIPTHDNPLISREVLQNIKDTMPATYYNERILGQWQSYGGLVMTEFTKKAHVFESYNELPNDLSIWGGMDFGEVAMSVFLIIGHSASTGAYYVLDELAREGVPIQRFCLMIKNFLAEPKGYHRNQGLGYKDFPIFSEDAKAGYIHEFNVAGFDQVHPARKQLYENYHKESIRYVNGMYKRDELFIFAGCQNLIENNENYAWDKETGDPKKGFEDSVDALRYAIYGDLLGCGFTAQQIFDVFSVIDRSKKIEVPQGKLYDDNEQRKLNEDERPHPVVISRKMNLDAHDSMNAWGN